MGKVSLEDYKKQLFEINPNLEVIDEQYINHRRHVLTKCLVCGDIRWKDAPNLMQGHGCYICANKARHEKQRKNHDQFIMELKEVQPNLSVISQYYNAVTAVTVECLVCGNIYDALPNNLLKGHGCKNCYLNNRSRTKEEFQNAINEITDTITVCDDFVNGKTPCSFLCSVCGTTRKYIPNLFLSKGCQCPKCNGNLKMTPEEYRDFIKTENPYIEVLTEYTGIKDSDTYKCIKCGYIWDDLGDTIKVRNYRCPHCQTLKSKMEDRIANYLDKNKISYDMHVRFDDLIGNGGGKLSYDFYLKPFNLLIEAQGEQHLRPVNHFGGDKQFIIQQEHDKRKKEYAKSHNISLLEIWHWDYDNIESILSDRLKVA